MTSPAPSSTGRGVAAAIAAYVLWGFMPLYFVSLRPAGPFEVVAWRIVFSLIFCALLLTVTRGWKRMLAIARRPRILLTMGAAGAFIYVNWQVYVLASLGGEVVQASLGYFINPIITVLLGVIVLRERLRPAQWAAVGISVIAVIVIAIGYGAVPWISLILACSFGLYGFIKKRVGGEVDAVSGLTLETAWLTPVAIVQLVIVGANAGLVFGSHGVANTILISLAGVITAVPLLLFAAGARRLPLVLIGLTQYFAPVLQLLVGVVLLHERMTAGRWTGFALIWIALIILTSDSLVAFRRGRVPADPQPKVTVR